MKEKKVSVVLCVKSEFECEHPMRHAYIVKEGCKNDTTRKEGNIKRDSV